MEFICQYCGKECKNKNSLAQHEIRCKLNPNKIPSGNKGNLPKHFSNYYNKLVVAKGGDVLDITNEYLEKYRLTHNVCEICGKL